MFPAPESVDFFTFVFHPASAEMMSVEKREKGKGHQDHEVQAKVKNSPKPVSGHALSPAVPRPVLH